MAISRVCSIPNCGKPHIARGWCAAHYAKWRQYGDPTASASSKLRYFFEEALGYEGDDCLIWPYATSHGGYAMMDAGVTGTRYVHRIICETIYGPPPSPAHETAHSCGNRPCLNKKHLRWATPLENSSDQLAHGTRARGEKQGGSKLTRKDVNFIRSHKGDLSQGVLARRFGVSRSLICMIQKHRVWAWLS